MSLIRNDAGESAFFVRELEHIIPDPFDTKHAPLKALDFVPVDESAHPGDQTVTYQTFDQVGVAALIQSYSDGLPRADVKGTEHTHNIKTLGTSFAYNVDEVRASMRAGRSLDDLKARAAARALAAQIDKIAAVGDEAAGLVGLLTLPNSLDYSAKLTKEGGKTTWADKSATQILADLNGIASYIYETTNEVEVPDTILLPPAQFARISAMPLNSTSDTTVLEFFLRTNQFIKSVDQWHRLKGLGGSGKDRMFCYRRDKNAVRLILPVDFEMEAPQARGLEFIVPVTARCGGVISPYPLSTAFADGI